MRPPRFCSFLPTLALAAAPLLAQGTLTLQLEDYASAPPTGVLINSTDNSIYVARINFLREEPGGGLNRFWLCDLNGRLYFLDQATKQFTTYLDFQRNPAENATATGLFPAFTRNQGYANGLVTFQFDPEYRVAGSAHFGKFYTVHIEFDTNDGDPRRRPNASAFPGFASAASYAPSAVNEAPGTDNANTRHAVLIEWQDTNPTNTTFEGTARELMRVEFNGRIHPMGDLLFNPLATSPAHPDWRKMYIAVGDGGAGEQNNTTLNPTPQRLDVLPGKILRIIPDDPDGDGPLRYTIPADNPFAPPLDFNRRGEIWAYGFRNPHRITWDPVSNLLLASDIGFHSWEEVNIVKRGANYGWAPREGTHVLNLQTGLATVPAPPRVTNDSADLYAYPVLQYPHSPALGYGDAIAGGFVYRGTHVPQLQGKFIFGDITTGLLFYTDLAALVAADDNDPHTVAAFHRIEVLWDNPRDPAPAQRYDRMYEIVEREYRARGGPLNTLPGAATVSDLTGGGRADIRLAVDAAGELYILSKSDGMIRAVTGAVGASAAPHIARQPESHTVAPGGAVAFSVEAQNASAYQWKRNGTPIAGATASMLTLSYVSAAQAGSYTVDVINSAGARTSSAATLAVIDTMNPGRIINFSIRSVVGSGAQTLIMGFGTRGFLTDPQTLLLRAVGPGLAPFGITNGVADPRLELFRVRARLAENDNWGTNAAEVTAVGSRIGAFPLAAGSRDAALVQTSLAPGSYTMQITEATASNLPVVTVALAEIFDATPARGPGNLELHNVSARTLVASGSGTLIAGFAISGTTARTVLLRAAGPALSSFAVGGVLPDPKLTLFRGDTQIAENDNWQTSAEIVNLFAQAGAFPFVARSRDAVLYLTLPPGLYTAHVSGVTTANGVALIEIYLLP